MFKNLSIKIAKQSASNLSNYLKDAGYNMPRNIILEAISKVFFFKNWNTMEGIISSPVRDDFEKTKKKTLFIKINKDKEYLLKTFRYCAQKANCDFEITDVKQNGSEFKIEFDFLKKGSNNFLTLIMILGPKMKEDKCEVEHCYFWDVSIQRESLTEWFKQ